VQLVFEFSNNDELKIYIIMLIYNFKYTIYNIYQLYLYLYKKKLINIIINNYKNIYKYIYIILIKFH